MCCPVTLGTTQKKKTSRCEKKTSYNVVELCERTKKKPLKRNVYNKTKMQEKKKKYSKHEEKQHGGTEKSNGKEI